jgi:hypothetical protein
MLGGRLQLPDQAGLEGRFDPCPRGIGNDIVDEYQGSLAGAAQKWLVKHGYIPPGP